jgi:hypothetical protein
MKRQLHNWKSKIILLSTAAIKWSKSLKSKFRTEPLKLSTPSRLPPTKKTLLTINLNTILSLGLKTTIAAAKICLLRKGSKAYQGKEMDSSDQETPKTSSRIFFDSFRAGSKTTALPNLNWVRHSPPYGAISENSTTIWCTAWQSIKKYDRLSSHSARLQASR